MTYGLALHYMPYAAGLGRKRGVPLDARRNRASLAIIFSASAYMTVANTSVSWFCNMTVDVDTVKIRLNGSASFGLAVS